MHSYFKFDWKGFILVEAVLSTFKMSTNSLPLAWRQLRQHVVKTYHIILLDIVHLINFCCINEPLQAFDGERDTREIAV